MCKQLSQRNTAEDGQSLDHWLFETCHHRWGSPIVTQLALLATDAVVVLGTTPKQQSTVGFSWRIGWLPSQSGVTCMLCLAKVWFRTTQRVAHPMKLWSSLTLRYGSHDLFLVGESYAGVYVPMLAREILQQTTHPGLNLLQHWFSSF